MSDCLFCRIVDGEIPAAKVYEDNDCIAFLDIAPVNKGHTLVIPKDHVETLMDLTPKYDGIMTVASKVAQALVKATGCDGINLAQNNHEAAGQVVPHFHIHVIPRFTDDGLKLWPQGSYPEGEMDALKDKIKSNL